jgi:transcriptional regulator with XRE-family HTH domain
MRKDAVDRIRLRIRSRLDELGMTARELARAVRQDATDDREKDGWISGILSGRQGLHVKYLDAVAEKLALSPSELVRHDDAALRELTPREMRLLKHYQEWPSEMQDRWLAMLDYFAASIPDKETATILDRLRTLPPSWRRPVLGWLYRLLEEGIPPEALTLGAGGGQGEVPAEPATPRPGHQKKQLSAKLRKKPPPIDHA